MEFLTLGVLFLLYIGALIYLANLNDLEQSGLQTKPVEIRLNQRLGWVRWMLFGLVSIAFLFGLLVLQLALVGPYSEAFQQAGVEIPQVDPFSAVAFFVFTLVVCFICVRLIVSSRLRAGLRRLVGLQGHYNPDSSVHLVAAITGLWFLVVILGQFLLAGGIAGLAEALEQSGIPLGALIFQAILLVAVAFLGVGLAIRRTLPQSLERLGLRLPTPHDVLWGIGGGLFLFGVTVVLYAVWTQLVPEDQLTQQQAAAEQLVRSFDTLPLALLISISAAVSEEILFRGAVQPVFGLTLTSILFAIFHSQYVFTPATLIIFVIGAGLGWLRQKQNTTSAILAHFVYDFVQLALAILVGSNPGGF
jgi:hypothetical protein